MGAASHAGCHLAISSIQTHFDCSPLQVMVVLQAIRAKEEQLSNQRHVLETLTGLEDQVRVLNAVAGCAVLWVLCLWVLEALPCVVWMLCVLVKGNLHGAGHQRMDAMRELERECGAPGSPSPPPPLLPPCTTRAGPGAAA